MRKRYNSVSDGCGGGARGFPLMKASNVKKITRRSFFSLSAALTFIFLSCGEPYYFPTSSWQMKAVPPGGYKAAMACHKNAVFFVTENKIVKFDGAGFTEDYVAREGVQFYDVGFSGNDGWAVGADNAAEKAFIVHNGGGRWQELVINEGNLSHFLQVIPVGRGRCWLVAFPSSLFFWDGARLRLMAGGAPVTGGCYDQSNGVLYTYRAKGPNNWELLITGDGGKSWLVEKIPAFVNGLRVQIYSWAAGNGAVYFAGLGTSPIVKRTGGAGPGEYEIVFRSGVGPNFRDVKDMAFNEYGYGVAVGDDTTVVFSPERIYVEETIDVQFTLVSADAAGGFWALGGDPLGQQRLYYRR